MQLISFKSGHKKTCFVAYGAMKTNLKFLHLLCHFRFIFDKIMLPKEKMNLLNQLNITQIRPCNIIQLLTIEAVDMM